MEYLSSGVGGPGGVKGMTTWRVSEKSLRPALWDAGVAKLNQMIPAQ